MTAFDPFNQPNEEKAQRPPPQLVPLEGSLKDLDLDKELYTQYARAKNLLALSETDEETALNQKVQAQNSIVQILGRIVELQSNLYNAKTAAEQEAILISVLKRHPELKDAFLADYKKALNV